MRVSVLGCISNTPLIHFCSSHVQVANERDGDVLVKPRGRDRPEVPAPYEERKVTPLFNRRPVPVQLREKNISGLNSRVLT